MEAGANRQNSSNCLRDVRKKLRLAAGKLSEAQKQSSESHKAEEKVLHQLTEVSIRALLLKGVVNSLRTLMNKAANARDDMGGLAE